MATTNFHIAGLQELEDAIRKLREEMTKRGQAGKEGKLIPNAIRHVMKKNIMPRMVAAAPQSERGSHIDWHYSRNGKWVHGGDNGTRADPGRLKRSIFYKPERNPRYLNEVGYVGPRLGANRNDEKGAWYAAIVEFKGGAGGKGRGFMRNSVDPLADTQEYARHLGRAIERAAKKIGDENLRAVGAKYKKFNAGNLL